MLNYTSETAYERFSSASISLVNSLLNIWFHIVSVKIKFHFYFWKSVDTALPAFRHSVNSYGNKYNEANRFVLSKWKHYYIEVILIEKCEF